MIQGKAACLESKFLKHLLSSISFSETSTKYHNSLKEHRIRFQAQG